MFVIKVKSGEMGLIDTILSVNCFSGENVVMKGYTNKYRVEEGVFSIIDNSGRIIHVLDSLEILEDKHNHSYTELVQAEINKLK